jgi:asparagine synthase (glutamine-hydrolysing)
MCGIAGFADPELDPSIALERLRPMLAAIRHRGPDDEGAFAEAGIVLGMRRLSIIDLATGQQPIHNEDRTIWVVFNGEIYNYSALRGDLEERGHRFYTSSDTETIVHAYEEWGEEAFARLRGMFGIALWDSRNRALVLARDRAGIKPLHYAVADNRLYFGSEIKSLLESGAIERRLDASALDHYLAFLYTPRESSIFAGVRKLPPGHVARWADGRLTIRRFWELPAFEQLPEGDAVATVRQVLREAVSSHLMSEVPLGAFLSGGVDSSVVVALMAHASGRPVKTFSIGFNEPRFDELPHARLVAEHLGTDHHEFVVKPDALAIVDDLVTHFDEPFGDASAIPTWYVSQIASRHVTVVLSGDGGDELFGGYDRYIPHPRVAAFDRWAPPGSRAMAGALWPRLRHGARGKNFLRRVARDERGRYVDAMTFFQYDERASLLSGDVRAALNGSDPETSFDRRFNRFAGRLPWDAQMMAVDFETYLPEDILTKIDRMSMAHSIESRVPLLDNEVIELAARLPARLKIQNGRRKHILKEAAAGLVPASILTRRKQGFGVPIGVWFRNHGLRDLFGDLLLSPRARQRGYFDSRFVVRLVEEHLAARREHTLRLWGLAMFELWHRLYLDTARHDVQPAQPIRVACEA